MSLRHLPFLLLVVGLALTPFYALSFLLVIIAVSRWNPWRSSLFASYVTRCVVNFLLFNAISMLIGMYCWLLKVSVYPVVLVAFSLLLYYYCRSHLPQTTDKGPWISYHDKLALGLSSIGIVILLACFYLPRPALADSIRLLTNGYDNSAHLSLIETTYRAHGYVYAPYQQIKEQIAYSTLTGYPQGWHLTSALWWRGIGVDVFSSRNVSLRLNLYIVTILLWQLVAGFLFTRTALYISELLGYGKQLRRAGIVIGFAAINLLLQMLVFWGTTFYGFAPFIGAVCYLLLATASLIAIYADRRESKGLAYCIALISSGAVTMAWLLPAPLLLLMIVFAYGSLLELKTIWPYVKTNWRRILPGAAITVLVVVAILSQVVINYLYSTEGGNQIDDQGGIFILSNALVLLILGFTTWVIFARRGGESFLTRVYLVTCAPIMLGVLLIYGYQMATLGKTVYFFTKMTALLLVVVGMYCCAAMVKILSNLRFEKQPQVYVAITAILVVGSAIVFTGQPIFNFTSLLNRSVISNATAYPISHLASTGQLASDHVLVFTGRQSVDLQATVFTTTAPLHFDSCVASVESAVIYQSNAILAKTRECTSVGEHFIFVTSPQSEGLIKAMRDPNVRTLTTRQ